MKIASRATLPANLLVTLGLSLGLTITPAHAQEIRSPVAIVTNTVGDLAPAFSLTNAIDHSGLLTNFTSGVTPYSPYLAGNPQHVFAASGNEWVGNFNTPAGVLVFDLGDRYIIERMALWNEDSTGIETVRVSTSDDPTFATFASVGTFNPINGPASTNYGAGDFALLSTYGRYVRLEVSNTTSNLLSMGEVAFQTAAPEPGTLVLVAAGLVAGVALRRRRRA